MKIIEWFGRSNRYKHLIGGMAVGFSFALMFGIPAGIAAGILAASCLEFKDRQWGGAWDWVDWALTVAGAIAGSFAALPLL